jgi:integrase
MCRVSSHNRECVESPPIIGWSRLPQRGPFVFLVASAAALSRLRIELGLGHGLRSLQALRASDVDLAAGVIRVERGWDPVEGAIGLKSRAGRRRVPIPAVLRDELLEHQLRTGGREGDQLLFGPDGTKPFPAREPQRVADAVWKKVGLQPITPHECRHTYASLMIAAG